MKHLTRREAITHAAIAGGAALLSPASFSQPQPANAGRGASIAAPEQNSSSPPGEAGRDYTPVIVPNGWTLSYKLIDGIKVFHLLVEEVDHEFAPGLKAHCWGYNGSVHGPVIEAVEGDRLRIFVTNHLPAGTTVHWHGLLVPSGMDGVGGLSQKAIAPGETYVYEFTLRQHGTLMYHSHHDEMTQMGLGLTGLLIIHPRNKQNRPDRDFAIMLHEWKIDPGTERPDPGEMTDFNVLTMNARIFPGTAPLVVQRGQRVRVRLGNLGSMSHHTIHLHGYQFKITETEGGEIAAMAQMPETTVMVGVGTTRTIEFVADNPGDWAMHCHMSHHVMNQMGHGLPNMIGVKPEGIDAMVRPLLPTYMTMGQSGMAEMGEMGMAVPPNSLPMVGARGPYDYITMGGMFTVLKVREQISDFAQDPGWYVPPPGTLASVAPADVLRANQIAADGTSAPRPPSSVQKLSNVASPLSGASATTQPGETLYTCPMHPEVILQQPGKCPKCGMTLVVKK